MASSCDRAMIRNKDGQQLLGETMFKIAVDSIPVHGLAPC